MGAPEAALMRGRAAVQNLMRDTCQVKRLTGEDTDRDTGQVTPTWTVVYSGSCRVVYGNTEPTPRPEQVAGAQVYLSHIEVHLPVTATGIQADDLVVVTYSALDPDLPGRTYRVREVAHKTYLTARRLGVEEVTS